MPLLLDALRNGHRMGDAQAVAAFGPAALKDIAAIWRRHPVTEAVCLHFVPDFRLVSAFHRAYPL